MTTSDLERQLAVVLQQHAEDAMKSTDTRGRLDSLVTEHEPGRWHGRRRTWAAVALVAAAAAIVAIALALGPGLNREQAVTPAAPADPSRVATTFLDAYAARDGLVMTSVLSDGAELALGVDGATSVSDWLGSEARWHQAVGFRMLDESCRPQAATGGATTVVCTYDYHALGSDRLGVGPFSGSTLTATVKDGKVIAVRQNVPFLTNGFSREAWEPFAAWVRSAYPEDAPLMYADWPTQNLQAYTDRSIELWAKHTQDYVNANGGRTTG